MSTVKKVKAEDSPPKQGQRKDDAKRANHNALERKRRIFQKERLLELKDCVPTIKDEKSSTVEILQKATEYIEDMVLQISQKEREIEQIGNAKVRAGTATLPGESKPATAASVVKRARSEIEENISSGSASTASAPATKRPRESVECLNVEWD